MMIEVMDSNNLKMHLKGDKTSIGDVAKNKNQDDKKSNIYYLI